MDANAILLQVRPKNSAAPNNQFRGPVTTPIKPFDFSSLDIQGVTPELPDVLVNIRNLCKHLTQNVLRGNVPLKQVLRAGNKKLPRGTAIFNMGPASVCPSLRLGMCQAYDAKGKHVCYALKSEYGYRPSVLPFRFRQMNYWMKITAEEFAWQFILINAAKRLPYTKIRFNEAGDFWSQGCVDKAEAIAKILKGYGVQCYCYTARKDLDYSKVTNLVINASGFQKSDLHNEFLMVKRGENPPKGYVECVQDCRICDRCSHSGNKTYVMQH